VHGRFDEHDGGLRLLHDVDDSLLEIAAALLRERGSRRQIIARGLLLRAPDSRGEEDHGEHADVGADVEGDRVRIYVTNKLPAATSIHWHGIILPNGMDGVSGLTQTPIKPGETFKYEFTLKQHGTQMYHPHSDEMTQMAMGMQGFFVIHPKDPDRKIDRDFCIFLQEWFVEPGSATPNPMRLMMPSAKSPSISGRR